MPDILHGFETKSSVDQAYRAFATRAGLAGWWTTDTRGDERVGGVIQFVFGSRGRIEAKVLELEPGRRVCWQVVAGPPAWIGTKINFELRPRGQYTTVLFKHEGWREPMEFMHHCTTKWGTFLMSAKSLVETGTGAPYPNDVHITGSGD